MATHALRREDQVGAGIGQQALEGVGEIGADTVVGAKLREEFGRRGIAAVGCLAERQVDGLLDAERARRRPILAAAQGHVVDLGRQTLVGLAGQREAARVRDGGGEDGRHHDLPAPRGEPGQRAAGREGGVVEMGRDGERGSRHSRCGSVRKRQSGSRGSVSGKSVCGRSRATSA